MPLVPGLSGAHEKDLCQLADLLLKLQQEPRVVPGDPVPAGVGTRYRFDLVRELPHIHAGSAGGTSGRRPGDRRRLRPHIRPDHDARTGRRIELAYVRVRSTEGAGPNDPLPVASLSSPCAHPTATRWAGLPIRR
ncbi:hypothetical protein GCM10023075_44120 [Streptosporangium album]